MTSAISVLLFVGCATTLSRDWSLIPVGQHDDVKVGIFYFPAKEVFDATLETLLDEKYNVVEMDRENGFIKALTNSWGKLNINCFIRQREGSVKVDFQAFTDDALLSSRKDVPAYFEMWYRTIWLRLNGKYTTADK